MTSIFDVVDSNLERVKNSLRMAGYCLERVKENEANIEPQQTFPTTTIKEKDVILTRIDLIEAEQEHAFATTFQDKQTFLRHNHNVKTELASMTAASVFDQEANEMNVYDDFAVNSLRHGAKIIHDSRSPLQIALETDNTDMAIAILQMPGLTAEMLQRKIGGHDSMKTAMQKKNWKVIKEIITNPKLKIALATYPRPEELDIYMATQNSTPEKSDHIAQQQTIIN